MDVRAVFLSRPMLARVDAEEMEKIPPQSFSRRPVRFAPPNSRRRYRANRNAVQS